MKKILLVMLLVITLTGCGKVPVEDIDVVIPGTVSKKSNFKPDNDKGIKLELVEGSLSNKSINLNIINTTDETLYYGTPFAIEKYEDDKWYTLKYIRDDIAWTMPLFSLNPNSMEEFNVGSWEYMYGALPAGKYRFIKEVYFTEDDEFTVSYEFEVK